MAYLDFSYLIFLNKLYIVYIITYMIHLVNF